MRRGRLLGMTRATRSRTKTRLGAQLAHTSTGNDGKCGVGVENQKSLLYRQFLPFHAHRNPRVPTMFGLDKAEVTGSSPVSPMPQTPHFYGAFGVFGGC